MKCHYFHSSLQEWCGVPSYLGFSPLPVDPSWLSHLSAFCFNFPIFPPPYELSCISFPFSEWKNVSTCGLGNPKGRSTMVYCLVGKWEIHSGSHVCWFLLFWVPLVKDFSYLNTVLMMLNTTAYLCHGFRRRHLHSHCELLNILATLAHFLILHLF